MSNNQFNEEASGLPATLTGVGTFNRSAGLLSSTGATPSAAGWLFYEDLGSPNINMIINIGHGSSSSSAPAALFRFVDIDNCFMAAISTSGVLGLYLRQNGAFGAPIATYNIPSFGLGNRYSLTIVLDGNNIKISVNASLNVIDLNNASFNTATIHGGRFGASGQVADRMELAALSVPYISVNQSDLYSQQQVNGSRTITFNGSHGYQSGAIHYKLNGGVAQVGVANPTGNSWAIPINISEGINSLEFFFADDVAVSVAVSGVAVIDWIHGAGQSNESGYLGNNETFVPNAEHTAIILGNDDVFKIAQDPIDSNVNQSRAISSYANAGGSYNIHMLNAYVLGQNKSIGYCPNSIGSVGVDRWQKTDSSRMEGLNLYEAMAERIVITGGCRWVKFTGGETNIAAGMDKATFKTLLNQFVNDVYADFGAKTIVVPFQTITKAGYDGNGTTTGQNPLRDAQNEVGNENLNAILVEPLSDIPLLTTGSEDGLHYITTAQRKAVGDRVYQSVFEPVETIQLTGQSPSSIGNTMISSAINLTPSFAAQTDLINNNVDSKAAATQAIVNSKAADTQSDVETESNEIQALLSAATAQTLADIEAAKVAILAQPKDTFLMKTLNTLAVGIASNRVYAAVESLEDLELLNRAGAGYIHYLVNDSKIELEIYVDGVLIVLTQTNLSSGQTVIVGAGSPHIPRIPYSQSIVINAYNSYGSGGNVTIDHIMTE
jgi:hypothetical protein